MNALREQFQKASNFYWIVCIFRKCSAPAYGLNRFFPFLNFTEIKPMFHVQRVFLQTQLKKVAMNLKMAPLFLMIKYVLLEEVVKRVLITTLLFCPILSHLLNQQAVVIPNLRYFGLVKVFEIWPKNSRIWDIK